MDQVKMINLIKTCEQVNFKNSILAQSHYFNHKISFSALLKLENMYIISVDWSPITFKGCREASSNHTRIVGNCTGHFIDTLIEKTKVTLKDIHVIGFSLGAQATAVISRNMKSGKINHITG